MNVFCHGLWDDACTAVYLLNPKGDVEPNGCLRYSRNMQGLGCLIDVSVLEPVQLLGACVLKFDMLNMGGCRGLSVIGGRVWQFPRCSLLCSGTWS